MAWVLKTTGEVPEGYGDIEWDETIHVDEHDIWNAGNEAFDAGRSKVTNPWPENSYAWCAWEDGWDDGDMNGVAKFAEDE